MKKSKTASFVLSLKMQCNKKDTAWLNKAFFCGNCIYNGFVSFARKQLGKMTADSEYKQALEGYTDGKTTDAAAKRQYAAILQCKKHEYRLTVYDLEKYGQAMQHKYAKYIDCNTMCKIAAEVAVAVDAFLYRNGKQIHYRKITDMLSLEGKTNAQGIRYVNGRLVWMGHQIGLQAPSRNDSQRRYYEEAMAHRLKYCRIKRRIFGSGWQYYLELILEGYPPEKHVIREGAVGIDIGTSSVAAVGNDSCILQSLGKGVRNREKEIQRIDTLMDASRRKSNPENYNRDGTIKKGRKRWCFTNSYRKLRNRRSALFRRRRESMKQWRDQCANDILSMGNVIYVEQMSFKGLQHKAKETKRTGRIVHVSKKDGTARTVYKCAKKKRFGKTINRHAPAALISVIEHKLAGKGLVIRINTYAFKASQYNHITDTCIKPNLRTRVKNVGGHIVQRDLYSAFLLQHTRPDLAGADQKQCISDYNRFIQQHNQCIRNLITSNDKNATFGLACFKAIANS